jgi:hypothetical protein
MKNPLHLRRFFGAAMVLFVFFVPFHFHHGDAPVQLAKECSCVHGTRIEAGLASAPAGWIPVLTERPVQSGAFDCSSIVQFKTHGIRAPPLTPSL